MKNIYLVALLLASAAFSGCVQQNQEKRAIALADKLPEVILISKIVDNMQRADQCTFDKFYSGYKKIYEAEEMDVPEITESQRVQAEAMIQQMGALAKRCQITLSKSAEKESENVYLVRYDFETITDPDCSALSLGDAQVRVDLSTEKAEAIGGGSQDVEKYEAMLDELGECTAISMISFAQASTQMGAIEPQTTGGVGPAPRSDPHNCSASYSDSKTKWCCTDSDGTYYRSDSQYTKGTTEYKVIDLESGAIEEGTKTDSCDGNTLTEWKCGRGNREEHNALLSEEFVCPDGCQDGACIGEAAEEEPPIDSDRTIIMQKEQ